jgi:predicted O-methyltransferase YrrM
MSYRRLAEALLEGRPYFGPALRALQGLAIRHKYILLVVKALARKGPIEILEVGSWAGASAISWASALKKLGFEGHVTCVDPWRPYFDLEAQSKSAGHYERMNHAAQNGAIRKLFEHNVASAGFSDIIIAKAGKSSEILPGLAPESYDIVYLDGSHSFEDVLFDLREAKRLLRPGGIICGDDLELQLQNLDPAEVEDAVNYGRDFVSSSQTGEDYHPGITLAVAQELGQVSSWDGFWAYRFSADQGAKVTLELEDGDLPDHLMETAMTIEADEPTHHVIRTEGRYFAVSKQLGPPDIAAELLGATDLPPYIFTGSTLDEVLQKIHRDHEQRADPELVGSYLEFNLVRFQGRVYGLRQSLGYVDVAIGDAEIEGRYSREDILINDSVDELKARIDALTVRSEGGELTCDRSALLEKRLQSLEKSLVETTEMTNHLRAQLDQAQAGIRSLTDELLARFYGPAGGEAPQLLEWYREFKLVRHGNRFYGIRGSLGDVDVLAGSTVLEARFGDEDVIAGECADGVKARIDAVRAERAVRELTDRLNEPERPRDKE